MNKPQDLNHSQFLLRLIGSEPDSARVIERILAFVENGEGVRGAVLTAGEVSRVITPGNGLFLLSEEKTRSILSLCDQIKSRNIQLNPEIPETMKVESKYWAASILKDDHDIFGVFWIEADSELVVDGDKQEFWESMVDGLTIAARSLHISAQHQKRTRNKVDFIRIVAHDLRSPLTSMKGFVGMLEAVGELTEQQAYYVEKILSGISQMALLVDNFQDAGRYDPETGFYELQRSPCDVADIVQQIADSYLVPAEKQELTITTQVAQDLPILNVDQVMLERAITNLMDNAIKYTPNGGKVEVGVELRDDDIIIRVKDDGYGIKPEDQTRLFKRHERGNRKEHRRIKGSGLGLFIVSSVAQRHGGRAWMDSEEGVGTTFFISLPVDGENVLASNSE